MREESGHSLDRSITTTSSESTDTTSSSTTTTSSSSSSATTRSHLFDSLSDDSQDNISSTSTSFEEPAFDHHHSSSSTFHPTMVKHSHTVEHQAEEEGELEANGGRNGDGNGDSREFETTPITGVFPFANTIATVVAAITSSLPTVISFATATTAVQISSADQVNLSLEMPSTNHHHPSSSSNGLDPPKHKRSLSSSHRTHSTRRSLSSTASITTPTLTPIAWLDIDATVTTLAHHLHSDLQPLPRGNSPNTLHHATTLMERKLSSDPSSSRSVSTSHRHVRRISKSSSSSTAQLGSMIPRTATGMTALELVQRLEREEKEERRGLLIVDVRPLSHFLGERGRLKGSVNINFPSLLIKRFRRGNTSNFSLSAFISTAPGIALFQSLLELHGGSMANIDVLVVDDEIVGEKEASAGSVLLTVLERSEELGSVRYLASTWDQVRASEGIRKWIVVSEETEEEEEEEDDAPLLSNAPSATHSLQSTTSHRHQHNIQPHPTKDVISPLDLTAKPLPSPRPPLSITTPIQSPTSFVTPAIHSPRTPGGRRPPILKRLDTSDGVIRGSHHSHSQVHHIAPFRRPSPHASHSMSIQTLCHVQSRPSPTVGVDSSSSHWHSPLTPKTDLSAPPFEMSTIIPGFLYLGSAPQSIDDVETLRKVGVKEVVNMALECEDEGGKVERAMEKYWKIGMRDFVEEVGVQGSIIEGCRILAAAELQSKPVYVHCYAGRSRSVTIVLAYLIHRNHWTLKRAFAFVEERRHSISPNIGFISELMKWEELERGERSRGVFGTNYTPATSYFPHSQSQSPSISGPPTASALSTALVRKASGGANAGGFDRLHRKRDSLPSSMIGFTTSAPTSEDHLHIAGERERDREVRDKNGTWVQSRREAKDVDGGVTRRISKAGLESTVASPTTSWG